MPNSQRSSAPSASCRLEWRPSAWLMAALPVMAVLAALSLLVSGFPRVVTWPGAVLAVAWGIREWRREMATPVVEIEIDGPIVQVDDEPVTDFQVFWRGPLSFARWRDAERRVHRLAWWPDTLDAAGRRELRLALPAQTPARGRRSVAP
ncbi:hypothetical protein INQ40_07930 [Lysobacter sp. H21R4]|nr:hypothetical protein INQ40_07930 [Lysobacter sp. H21R4]